MKKDNKKCIHNASLMMQRVAVRCLDIDQPFTKNLNVHAFRNG